MVEAKRQERLPCILKSLAHRALDATIVLPDQLLHVNSLKVHLTICRLVLLKTVEMESVAALLERHASLILFINHICKLQVLHDEFVPLGVLVFEHGRVTDFGTGNL